MLCLLASCGVCMSQTYLEIKPLEPSSKEAYINHLSLYVEESMKLQMGDDIHGNLIFPMSAGLNYLFGNNLSSSYYEISLGYQIRRNRKF